MSTVHDEVMGMSRNLSLPFLVDPPYVLFLMKYVGFIYAGDTPYTIAKRFGAKDVVRFLVDYVSFLPKTFQKSEKSFYDQVILSLLLTSSPLSSRAFSHFWFQLKGFTEDELVEVTDNVRCDVNICDEILAKEDESKFDTFHPNERDDEEDDGEREKRKSASPLFGQTVGNKTMRMSSANINPLDWIRENTKRFAYSLATKYVTDYLLPGLNPRDTV